MCLFQFHALCVLHRSHYDLSKAVGSLVPSGGPVLCRDEMEEWSAGIRIKSFSIFATVQGHCWFEAKLDSLKSNYFASYKFHYFFVIRRSRTLRRSH